MQTTLNATEIAPFLTELPSHLAQNDGKNDTFQTP